MGIMDGVLKEKLMLQAEEAELQGMTKLATCISNAVSEEEGRELKSYSYKQLEEDIQKDVWKSAIKILSYYNPESIDASRLDEYITACAQTILDTIEENLDLSNIRSRTETKVPGEV